MSHKKIDPWNEIILETERFDPKNLTPESIQIIKDNLDVLSSVVEKIIVTPEKYPYISAENVLARKSQLHELERKFKVIRLKPQKIQETVSHHVSNDKEKFISLEMKKHAEIQKQQDQALDRIKNGLDGISHKAEIIGSELSESSKDIERVDSNVDKVLTKMTRVNRTLDKITKGANELSAKTKLACIAGLSAVALALGIAATN